MGLLQRYFWRQALGPLLAALSGLVILALLTQSLSTLDLIVENRQSTWVFIKITLLALPQLIAIILPLALFMAVLYALNRLNTDSELVVTKAAGFSSKDIASPTIRLAVYTMIAHLLINFILQPLSFREMRSELLSVRTDIASQMVRPGEFVSPTPSLTFYAREMGNHGKLKDVLIYDKRDQDEPITYSALSGNVKRGENTARLRLENGNYQSVTPNNGFNITHFTSLDFDLNEVVVLDSVLRLKASDRFLHELLKINEVTYASPNVRRQYAAEGHARISSPLYNLALSLLALCFLIRGEHQKLGYGRAITICAVTGFLIRLSGFTIASAAEQNSALNIIQYAIPLTLTLICAAYLLYPKRVPNLISQYKKWKRRRLLGTNPSLGKEPTLGTDPKKTAQR